MPKLFNTLTGQWIGDRLSGAVRVIKNHRRPVFETPMGRAKSFSMKKAREMASLNTDIAIIPDRPWNG